jgi:hypothetical protein
MPEKYSSYVSRKMGNFFQSLVDKRVSDEEMQDLRKKMDEVCQKCVKLKVMMQRSKEGYNAGLLEVKDPLPYSKVESLAEAMGVENGMGSDASDEIAYVLFGSLKKNGSQLGGKKKILVKAEVILKRK